MVAFLEFNVLRVSTEERREERRLKAKTNISPARSLELQAIMWSKVRPGLGGTKNDLTT